MMQGPEPMEATANEDVQSGRAESSTTAQSAPTLELPMMSAHQVQQVNVILVIEPSTQL
jgi:hypothetical protein